MKMRRKSLWRRPSVKEVMRTSMLKREKNKTEVRKRRR